MTISRMGGRGAVVPAIALATVLAGCSAKPSEQSRAPELVASVSANIEPLLTGTAGIPQVSFPLPRIRIAEHPVVPANRAKQQVAEKPDAPVADPLTPEEAKTVFSDRPGHTVPPSRF